MDTRGLSRTLIIFTLIFLLLNGNVFAQENKLYVSNVTTKMVLDLNNEWKTEYSKEVMTPIIIGKNYLKIGSDPNKGRFRLYGEIERSNINGGVKFTQSGYTFEGQEMKTSTVYWAENKSITVNIEFKNTIYFYQLDM